MRAKILTVMWALAAAVFLGAQPAQAYTVINFSNGCSCYTLNDGINNGTVPSFLGLQACPASNGNVWSMSLPESNGGHGTFPSTNIVANLPAPPPGVRRVLVCGHPPGSTPFIDMGGGEVYASYWEVACPNGVQMQQVPAASMPAWHSMFMNPAAGQTSVYLPVCAP